MNKTGGSSSRCFCFSLWLLLMLSLMLSSIDVGANSSGLAPLLSRSLQQMRWLEVCLMYKDFSPLITPVLLTKRQRDPLTCADVYSSILCSTGCCGETAAMISDLFDPSEKFKQKFDNYNPYDNMHTNEGMNDFFSVNQSGEVRGFGKEGLRRLRLHLKSEGAGPLLIRINFGPHNYIMELPMANANAHVVGGTQIMLYQSYSDANGYSFSEWLSYAREQSHFVDIDEHFDSLIHMRDLAHESKMRENTKYLLSLLFDTYLRPVYEHLNPGTPVPVVNVNRMRGLSLPTDDTIKFVGIKYNKLAVQSSIEQKVTECLTKEKVLRMINRNYNDEAGLCAGKNFSLRECFRFESEQRPLVFIEENSNRVVMWR
ncbi:MAG: hypothetical protein HQK53_15075 [Oligoflexia bacterium]|nr:hypothetical protein [Oligoflexia bacterium]